MSKTDVQLLEERPEEEGAWPRSQLDEIAPEGPGNPKKFPDLDYDPFEEDRQFVFQSLDDALEAVVECVAEERGSQWKLGAVVASTVDTYGKYGTYKKLAEAAFYTTRRLKTFEVLHHTFPPELRFPDQPLLLYETALEVDNPVLAVKMALDEKWSPRELADAISQAKGETVSRVCFCQTKTGPFDNRKQGQFGHLIRTLIIENKAI
jgi:hypothetical protein